MEEDIWKRVKKRINQNFYLFYTKHHETTKMEEHKEASREEYKKGARKNKSLTFRTMAQTNR